MIVIKIAYIYLAAYLLSFPWMPPQIPTFITAIIFLDIHYITRLIKGMLKGNRPSVN